MKKSLILIISIFMFTLGTPALAVDSTSSGEPSTPSAATTTPIEKKAQDLLDRVATKVAQIAKTNSRTYRGTIKSVGTNSYVLTTSEGDRTIATNDATEFYRIKAGRTSSTDFDGVKQGEDIVAMGAIDPSNKSMTAKQIITKIRRHIVAGPIEKIDNTVLTVNGEQVDIEDASYQKMDSEGKITDATTSDYEEGNVVFLLAHSKDAKTGVYSSLKSLVLTK